MALVTDRWYCSLTELKSELGETTTANDTRLGRYIAQASRWLETFTGRTFYPLTATKYWDIPRDGYKLFLRYEDLLALTTLSDDTGTITSSYYWLYPLNETPYHTIVLNVTDLGRSFEYDDDPNKVITTTGQWGYCADYVDTGLTLGAAVSDTTGTKINTGGAAEVGWMLLVDSEAMHVSAVSGTIATVQRGALGTTAATHSNGATVYRYTPPDDVTIAVMELAAHYNNTRASGGIKSESIGEYSITYGGTRNESVPPFALSVAQAYQRIGA